MAATVTATGTVNGGSSSTVTVSITIAAGDDCVVFCAGGYDGVNRLSATATLDGGAMTRLEEVRSSGGQHATLFVMYDDDVNWPGAGTFNAVATFTGNVQERGAAAALAGVDTGGTPSAGSAQGTGSSATTVSLTVGSETIDQAYASGVSYAAVSVHLNAATGDGIQFMFVNTYSANDSGAGTGDTVHEFSQNGGTSSSHIFLSRVVAGAAAGIFLPIHGRKTNTLLRM